MELAEFKPVLAALVLPPGGPLLLALVGFIMAARWRRLGMTLVAAALGALWLLSCHAVALELAGRLLPPVAPVAPAQLQQAQAIVVLGGGVLPDAPEYGEAQPAAPTLARLRYGVWLARRSGKPLAFAGGVGWSATGTGAASEGEVARRVAHEDYGMALRWVDDRSRDTAENAANMAALLQRDGVQRIVLVTDALHMPRASRVFSRTGLEVAPAPTQLPGWRERPLLEWLPSARGLLLCREVLRERLAMVLTED
jgi:uncharacterized SAM-binding protein YcdF (DUF218 family)